MNPQRMEMLSLILEFIQTGGVVAVLLLWLSDVRWMRNILFKHFLEEREEDREDESISRDK